MAEKLERSNSGSKSGAEVESSNKYSFRQDHSNCTPKPQSLIGFRKKNLTLDTVEDGTASAICF
jgi:hypothetical protein